MPSVFMHRFFLSCISRTPVNRETKFRGNQNRIWSLVNIMIMQCVGGLSLQTHEACLCNVEGALERTGALFPYCSVGLFKA